MFETGIKIWTDLLKDQVIQVVMDLGTSQHPQSANEVQPLVAFLRSGTV